MPWTLWPAGLLVLAIAALVRVRPTASAGVALAGVLTIAAGLVQLVPLPSSLLAAVDPHACEYVRVMRLGSDPGACAATQITVDPRATAVGLAVAAGAVLLFWACVNLFAASGIRRTIHAVLVVGIIVGIAAAIHQSMYAGRAYWWKPIELAGNARLETFGPFVNRNHFATWLIMAAPLGTGLLLTQAAMLPAARSWRTVVTRLDSSLLTLAVSCALLVVLLILTASRSGLTGLGLAVVLAWFPARRRLEPQTAWAAAGALALAAVLAIFAGNLAMIVHQAESTLREGAGGRLAIWRDTLGIIRDFWPAGSGIGTFSEVMTLYQTTDPQVHFNQAHNHYLQIAAEGGVLVGVPAAIALISLARAAMRRFADDRSGLWWTRLGAAVGVGAVAFQSLWETGLRMPANAALFAVVAAIALHPPRTSAPRESAWR